MQSCFQHLPMIIKFQPEPTPIPWTDRESVLNYQRVTEFSDAAG